MKLKSSEINIKRRLLLQGIAVSVPGFMLLTHSPASLAAISKQRELSFHHLHTNEKLYQRKCQNCIQTYETHPDWRSVAQLWVDVAENSLS